MTLQILIDTAREEDALACGHERTCEFDRGGLRVSVTLESDFGPLVTFNGMEGQVELIGLVEIDQVIRALQKAKALSERASVQAAEEL